MISLRPSQMIGKMQLTSPHRNWKALATKATIFPMQRSTSRHYFQIHGEERWGLMAMVWISQQDSSTFEWYASYPCNPRIDAMNDEGLGWDEAWDMTPKVWEPAQKTMGRETNISCCHFGWTLEIQEHGLRGSLHSHGDHALTETRHLRKSSQPHEEVHAQFWFSGNTRTCIVHFLEEPPEFFLRSCEHQRTLCTGFFMGCVHLHHAPSQIRR